MDFLRADHRRSVRRESNVEGVGPDTSGGDLEHHPQIVGSPLHAEKCRGGGNTGGRLRRQQARRQESGTSQDDLRSDEAPEDADQSGCSLGQGRAPAHARADDKKI